MSGHSKWATIRHKKGAADAKRGKIFSKLAKEMMVVARQGGGDPATNPTLRTLMQKAKSENMPSENIDRAIKKGTGDLDGVTYEEITYEGYAAGGVGMIVKVLTDNKNRAAAEIRHIFGKNGSSFAAPGSVSRSFERLGQIQVAAEGMDEDRLMTIVLEAGADDMELEDDQYRITTQPAAFNDVCEALEQAGIATTSAETGLVPTAWTPVTDLAQAQAVMRFVAALEDNDDVQEVVTNMDVDDSLVQALQSEN